jgi:EAL domain-containing protein (putative c-di-GMP-specific phosphodiesterase class I)
MFSLHSDQDLERILAGLAGRGAVGLLLIEAGPLDRIERRYGGSAHQLAVTGLLSLIREVALEAVSAHDLLVTEERPRGAILVFMFQPRSDSHFYTTRLRNLASRVSSQIRRHGRRVVYPYLRDPLELPVGVSVALHNPTMRMERQIMHAIDAARADAKLQAGLHTRRTARQVLKLIIAGNLNIRYEPIVHLETAQVVGFEALTRGPARSELASPAQLFHEAEAAGLLFELDCLCRKLALERASVLPRGKMLFLNCLPTSIGDPNLRVEGLRKVLEEHELRPSDLVLEISESESIENFGVFREVSDSCREVGVRIAIDDAGTGYASLEAIMEIHPDFIKTDMGLVRGIDSDPPRQEVVRALCSVARGIGAQVIAEGIETDAELRSLRELGVRYGQGYVFGAAIPGETPAGGAGAIDAEAGDAGEAGELAESTDLGEPGEPGDAGEDEGN